MSILSIFKLQPHSIEDSLKLLERLNYIRDPLSTYPDLWCSSYVSIRYPFEEMMTVKRCHISKKYNTLGGRQFFEFIVSLTEEESSQLGRFNSCVRDIVEFLSHWQYGHYQVLSCIHLNTDNLHAHIIQNNIDFMTGKRFTPSRPEFYAILDEVDAILKKHRFSGLIQRFNAMTHEQHQI